MIWARLEDAPDYRGIHPRLDRALELLTPAFLAAVTAETRYLEGDALYVTRFEYDTLPREETFFEAHFAYLDVHVMLSGRERVEIARPDALAEFERHDDFRGLRGEAEQTLLLRPGEFLVVFPGDAHRIKIADGAPERAAKAVFKIRYKEN